MQNSAVAAGLIGRPLPDLELPSTAGGAVAVGHLGTPRAVVFVYPRTGRPGVPLPPGWEAVPGAMGCTAEACSFRDHHAELTAAGADVYGLSSQDTAYQQEAVERLHLPFPVLSDERWALADALGLPTFTAAGMRLYERLTMVVAGGTVEHVFHPVPAPDRHAEEVLAWLRRGAGDR